MRDWNMQRELERNQHSKFSINEISSIETKSRFDSFDQGLQVLALQQTAKIGQEIIFWKNNVYLLTNLILITYSD